MFTLAQTLSAMGEGRERITLGSFGSTLARSDESMAVERGGLCYYCYVESRLPTISNVLNEQLCLVYLRHGIKLQQVLHCDWTGSFLCISVTYTFTGS